MAAKNRACVCVCILNATISSSNVVCTFFALKFNTCWMCSMCNASASCSRAISLSFIAPRTLFAVVVVVIHFNSFKYSQVRSEMIMNMPFRHIFVNYPETERDFVYSREAFEWKFIFNTNPNSFVGSEKSYLQCERVRDSIWMMTTSLVSFLLRITTCVSILIYCVHNLRINSSNMNNVTYEYDWMTNDENSTETDVQLFRLSIIKTI